MDCRFTTFSIFDLAGGFGFYVFHEVTNEVAHIDHISLVSNRLFTTMVDIAVDGVECAMSFDFEMGLIGNLVSLAPLDIQGEIRVGLARNTGSPNTIEISRPFSVGIEAILGRQQIVQNETFVPLVVKRVFKVRK
jgi:hypothetical protein